MVARRKLLEEYADDWIEHRVPEKTTDDMNEAMYFFPKVTNPSKFEHKLPLHIITHRNSFLLQSSFVNHFRVELNTFQINLELF